MEIFPHPFASLSYFCLLFFSGLYIILDLPNQNEHLPTFPYWGALQCLPVVPLTSLWGGPTLLGDADPPPHRSVPL